MHKQHEVPVYHQTLHDAVLREWSKVILAQEVSRVVGLTVDYDVDNGNSYLLGRIRDLHQIALL